MSDIKYCTWTENSDHYWDTSCHNSFCLDDGTPKDNEMNFCCYCGETLKQEVYKDEGDE